MTTNTRRDGLSDIGYVDHLVERNARASNIDRIRRQQREADRRRREEAEQAEQRRMVRQMIVGFAVIVIAALACFAALLYPIKAHGMTAGLPDIESAHLHVHGLSYHFDRTRDWDGRRYNERNWGAGLRFQTSARWSFQAGAYLNSYSGIQKDGSDRRRISGYLIVERTLGHVADAAVGGFGGITHNYPYQEGRIVPAGGAFARGENLWPNNSGSLTARVVPPIHPKVSGVLTLEPGVRVWSAR